MNASDKRWKVMISDNFDWEYVPRTPSAEFDTLEEAIGLCKSVVDAWLVIELEPGMQPAELFDRYTTFGEDPWVLGGGANGGVPFRAWDYARQRCQELCAGGGA